MHRSEGHPPPLPRPLDGLSQIPLTLLLSGSSPELSPLSLSVTRSLHLRSMSAALKPSSATEKQSVSQLPEELGSPALVWLCLGECWPVGCSITQDASPDQWKPSAPTSGFSCLTQLCLLGIAEAWVLPSDPQITGPEQERCSPMTSSSPSSSQMTIRSSSLVMSSLAARWEREARVGSSGGRPLAARAPPSPGAAKGPGAPYWAEGFGPE